MKRFLPIGTKVILPDGTRFMVDATEVDGVTVTARGLASPVAGSTVGEVLEEMLGVPRYQRENKRLVAARIEGGDPVSSS